ncbi:MAG: hypothetical protein ABI718_10300 [Acidobacteriota bacterium]
MSRIISQPALFVRWLHWCLVATSVIAAVVLFLAFRDKTLDPIIDTGRDLYIGEQMAGGHRLYRDLIYNYPPAGPLFLAITVGVFGAGLSTYQLFGVAVALLTAIALYAVTRTAAGPLPAAVAVLFFVCLSFTGASTWGANYLFPYAYAATMGMAFALLFLVSLLRYLFVTQRPLWLGLAVVCGMIATWSKIEYALLVAATFAFATIYYRLPLRAALSYLTLLVISTLAFSAYFAGGPFDFSWIREQLLSSSLLQSESSKFFYGQVSGTSSLLPSLAAALKGTLLIAVIVALIRSAGRPAGGDLSPERRRFLLPVVFLGIAVASWFLAGEPLFRAWAILQWLLLPAALHRGRRSPFALLLVFSLLSSARIALRTAPVWYGFVLAVPLFAMIVYVFFHELPRRGVYRVSWSWLWAPVFALTLFAGLDQQVSRYAMKRFPIVTPRGTFLDSNPDRAAVFTSAITFLDRHPAAGLVVFPEGVSVNYFSGIPSPLSRYIFTPIETAAPAVENEIVTQFQTKHPEYVIVLQRDVSEFGYRGFGVDYDIRVRDLLREHYHLERAWTPPRFSLVLLRRNS